MKQTKRPLSISNKHEECSRAQRSRARRPGPPAARNNIARVNALNVEPPRPTRREALARERRCCFAPSRGRTRRTFSECRADPTTRRPVLGPRRVGEPRIYARRRRIVSRVTGVPLAERDVWCGDARVPAVCHYEAAQIANKSQFLTKADSLKRLRVAAAVKHTTRALSGPPSTGAAACCTCVWGRRRKLEVTPMLKSSTYGATPPPPPTHV